MKLYIVKYCANEFDDLGYDDPYAIFYSLDEQKAKDFFENERKTNIEEFNYFIENHSEYKNNEDYQIAENKNDFLEIYMGNWFYQWKYEEREIDKDLRYNN